MKLALVSMLLSLAAMAACNPVSHPAVGTIPRDTPQECAADCGVMGMQVQSVVVIMNSTGCVCVPPGSPVGVSSGGAAAGGGATIAAIIAAQQESQRQQQSTTATHH